MTSRSILGSFIVLIALSSVFGQQPTEDEELSNAVFESVFRYQMNHCSENSSVVFLLSDHGKDPSDEFMKRFLDDKTRVKKKSGIADSSATNEFIEKESGKFAVLLSIDKMKILEGDKVEVDGSCGSASWAARGYKYTLVKEKKEWLVKRAEPTWVW